MSSENVPSRINRCLEEGAEEFFLKPVRLADVHRLKPHLLRTRFGQPHQQNVLEECHKPDPKPEQPQQQPEQSQQQEPQESKPEQQSILEECRKTELKSEPPNSNKRKSIEEGLSPDRTRPRYNDLTTVV